ncbi:uncharacterized protein [Elaeis guineensis]|uniref:uncharacterized protein n=1 Tax=Elaeis guineensis var. tenera TaxID=51953 RepID=UPI003C6D8AB6
MAPLRLVFVLPPTLAPFLLAIFENPAIKPSGDEPGVSPLLRVPGDAILPSTRMTRTTVTRTTVIGKRSAIDLRNRRKTRTKARESHLLPTSATARGQERPQGAGDLLSTSAPTRRREGRQGQAICYRPPPPPEDKNDRKGQAICYRSPPAGESHLLSTSATARGTTARAKQSAIDLRHRQKTRTTVTAKTSF